MLGVEVVLKNMGGYELAQVRGVARVKERPNYYLLG